MLLRINCWRRHGPWPSNRVECASIGSSSNRIRPKKAPTSHRHYGNPNLCTSLRIYPWRPQLKRMKMKDRKGKLFNLSERGIGGGCLPGLCIYLDGSPSRQDSWRRWLPSRAICWWASTSSGRSMTTCGLATISDCLPSWPPPTSQRVHAMAVRKKQECKH